MLAVALLLLVHGAHEPVCCVDRCPARRRLADEVHAAPAAPAPTSTSTRLAHRRLTDGANWASYTAAQVMSTAASEGSCTPGDAFTAISFESAVLVRSNLGGLGGRCRDNCYTQADGSTACVTWQSLCDEQCDLETPGGVCTSAEEIHIANIGTAPGNVCIDLRITNETEYRAWRTGNNGVKRVGIGTNVGFFGAINLLGPRLPAQRPYDKFWNAHFTIVQLRYAFVSGGARINASSCSRGSGGAPLTIGRTFMTFFDFDTGKSYSQSIPCPSLSTTP